MLLKTNKIFYRIPQYTRDWVLVCPTFRYIGYFNIVILDKIILSFRDREFVCVTRIHFLGMVHFQGYFIVKTQNQYDSEGELAIHSEPYLN